MADTLSVQEYLDAPGGSLLDSGPRTPVTAKSTIEGIARETQVPANVLMALGDAVGAPDDATKVEVARRGAAALKPLLESGASIEEAVAQISRGEEPARRLMDRAYQIANELYPQQPGSAAPAPGDEPGAIGRLGRAFEQGTNQAIALGQEGARRQSAAMEEGRVGQGFEAMREAFDDAVLTNEDGSPNTLGRVANWLRERATDKDGMPRDIVGGADATPEERATAIRDSVSEMEVRAKARVEELAASGFEIKTWSDINGLASGLMFLGENTANALPFMLAGAASGGTVTYPMLAGEAFVELDEKLPDMTETEKARVASATAAAMWALDTLGLGTVVGGMLPSQFASKALTGELSDYLIEKGVKRSAARILEAAVAEGSTEAMQEGILMAAVGMAGGDYTRAEVMERLSTAFAAGAGAGAGLRAGVEAASAVAPDREEAPQPRPQPTALLEPPALITPPPGAAQGATQPPPGPTGPTGPTPAPASAAPQPRGPMGRAQTADPGPITELRPGTPVTVSDGVTTLVGTLVSEDGTNVIIQGEDKTEYEIPREEIDSGLTSITQRQEQVDTEEGEVIEEPDAPSAPTYGGPPRTADEARARAQAIADVARQRGWDDRLMGMHDELTRIAEELEGEDPTVAEQKVADARERVTRINGDPFASEAAARRALQNRRLPIEDYDIKPEGGGFVAMRRVTPDEAPAMSEADAMEAAAQTAEREPAPPYEPTEAETVIEGSFERDAEDADEAVQVTVSPQGPWDFNDTWPSPDPEKLRARLREGRDELGLDGANPEGVVGVLEETLAEVVDLRVEALEWAEEAKRVKAGEKPTWRRAKKGETADDLFEEAMEKVVRASNRMEDIQGALMDVWGDEAVEAMVAHVNGMADQLRKTAPRGPEQAPPGGKVASDASTVPDSAFNGDLEQTLTDVFMLDDGADSVELAARGFTPQEVSALESAGLATDGKMDRRQFGRWMEERSRRLSAPRGGKQEAAADEKPSKETKAEQDRKRLEELKEYRSKTARTRAAADTINKVLTPENRENPADYMDKTHTVSLYVNADDDVVFRVESYRSRYKGRVKETDIRWSEHTLSSMEGMLEPNVLEAVKVFRVYWDSLDDTLVVLEDGVAGIEGETSQPGEKIGTPEKPAEDAPAPVNGDVNNPAPVSEKPSPTRGKTFKLADILDADDQKTQARFRDSNVGEIVSELDGIARRAADVMRREGKDPLDYEETGENKEDPGTFDQNASVIGEAAFHAREILHEARRQKTGDLPYPQKDEDTGEWFEDDASPLLPALEFIDNAEAMGLPIDTVDTGVEIDPEANTDPMPDAEIFPAPAEKTIGLTPLATKGPFVAEGEAAATVQTWKDAAAADAESGQNAKRVVISLFDYTGAWSQPWVDAGFEVLRIDVKSGSDILIDQAFILDRVREYREAGMEIYGVLSACPCTTFAGSGARWWEDLHDVESPEAVEKVFGRNAVLSGAKSPRAYNVMLYEATRDVVAVANPSGFHVLENPIGRIQTVTSLTRPAMRFHPSNFGDPYTKQTQLFGPMNTDLPLANVKPVDGSKMQSKLRGDNPMDKEARSTTPEGFAYAFYIANRPEGMAAVQAPQAPIEDGLFGWQGQADAAPMQDGGAEPVAEITTPGTNVKWRDLSSWLDGAAAINRRKVSSPTYRAAKAHIEELAKQPRQIFDEASTEDLQAFLDLTDSAARGYITEPPRGARAGTPFEVPRQIASDLLAQRKRNAAPTAEQVDAAAAEADTAPTDGSNGPFFDAEILPYIPNPGTSRSAGRGVTIERDRDGAIAILYYGFEVYRGSGAPRSAVTKERFMDALRAAQDGSPDLVGKVMPAFTREVRYQAANTPLPNGYKIGGTEQRVKLTGPDGKVIRDTLLVLEDGVAGIEAEMAQMRQIAEAGAASEGPQDTTPEARLFDLNPGTDTRLDGEVNGYRVDDVVEVTGRTMGPSTITDLFSRKMPGLKSTTFARIKELQSGKPLIVHTNELGDVLLREPDPGSGAKGDLPIGDFEAGNPGPRLRAWLKAATDQQILDLPPSGLADGAIEAEKRRRKIGEFAEKPEQVSPATPDPRAEPEQASPAAPGGWRSNRHLALFKSTYQDPNNLLEDMRSGVFPEVADYADWLGNLSDADLDKIAPVFRPDYNPFHGPTYLGNGGIADAMADFASVGVVDQETQAGDPQAVEAPARPAYGATNTLVSSERAEEIKKQLRDLLRNQTSAGIDPRILALGTELAVYHIEAGARRFYQVAQAIASDMGMKPSELRPFVRGWYMGARYMMEDSGQSIEGMDDPDTVSALLQGNFLEAIQPAENGGVSPAEALSDMVEPATQEQTDADRGDEGDNGTGAEEGGQAVEAGQAGGLRQGGSDTELRNDRGPDTGERPERATDDGGNRPAAGDRGSDLRGRPSRRDNGDFPAGDADHVIGLGDLEPSGGEKTRARQSIAAVRVLHQLREERRPPTYDEKQVLARYGGAGTLAPALPNSQGVSRMPDILAEIDALFTEEERATLDRTSQYAFYTAEPVVRGMWDMAQRLGFRGGKVFEPGMGVGGFAGTIPDHLRASTQYTGVELDLITAEIAKTLYPKSRIRQADFIQHRIPRDYYDLVIGNPPFARTTIQADPDYPQGFVIHDYFFAKSLDAVRPGGLLMFVTSAGTMNKIDQKARNYMADRADLVGAIRLPSTAFKDFAGTEVTTDVVILRKRLEGEREADPAWRESTTIDMPTKDGGTGQAAVNRYFQQNPDMILGEQGLFDTLVGNRVGVRDDGREIGPAFREAASKLPENVMSKAAPSVALEVGDADAPEWKTGSYYLEDGVLFQYDGSIGKPVELRKQGVQGGVPKAAYDRIKALVPVKNALRDVYSADVNGRDATEARKELNRAYDAFVKKFGPINKVERTERKKSRVEMEGLRARAFEEARNRGERFDIGSFDPAPYFERGDSMAAIARARAEAMEQPGYREGDFDPDSVEPNVIEKRPNIDPFMADQEGYRLRSIEDYDEKTKTATKGRVFTENAISVQVEPKITGPGDALTYVLATDGRVDLPKIAELAGVTEAEAEAELADQIFRNPASGDYEIAAKYLSGHILDKIEAAEEAMRKDEKFKRNVDALRAALPAPLGPDEIVAKLGASWVPSRIYAEWARSKGLSLEAEFIPSMGAWVVEGTTTGAAAVSDFGTDDVPFGKMVAALMNGREIVVKKKPDRDSAPVVDPESTQAANDKAKELREDFNTWVWSDADRSQQMQDIYNRTYNSEVAPKYDGSYLTTPGIHADWRWRPHQTAVIARILQSGTTYMAHAVGAGKTSAMIGATMEARRLGLAKKPMIVVPNHMLEQFSTEFYKQYPLAKLAIADEQRFHTHVRKQFVADIQANEHDAVIITHSAFKLIPVSQAARSRILGAVLDDLREAIEATKGSSDRGADQALLGAVRSVAKTLGVDVVDIEEAKIQPRKKLEQMLEAAEQRIRADATVRGQDAVADFDELGVDMLFVDEAHMFRKLSFPTQMSSVKGVDGAGSTQSMDLFVKSRLVDERNPGRGLIFASGTPITNTMGELYSLSRFLQPEALERRNIASFDAWAQSFGETTTQLEQQPAGGFKPVTRFAKFVNVPELSVMVRQTMDVVTSNDLSKYVTRPTLKDGKRNLVVVPRSDEVAAIQSDLAGRLERMKNLKPEERKGKYHHFSITNDGRMSAIDPRLVDPSASGEGSKLNTLIRNVFRIWEEGAEAPLHGVKKEGGYSDKPIARGPTTQIVFSTLGINGSQDNPGFRVHEHIKSELVRMGVPAREIILQDDLKTSALKQRAFNDMNEGKRRILIGGKTLFTGVNAQRRLYAVHNLDPLWFPADDEQRNGRALRQGNMNPEIEIIDYSTQDTYDATMWQLMGRKASFIEGFFRGDPEMRDMEDLGEASVFEQAMAMSISDHRVFELQEWKAERETLNRRKSAAGRNKRARLRDAENAERDAEWLSAVNADLRIAAEKTPSTKGDAFSIQIGDETFTKRKDAGAALTKRLEELLESEAAGWFKVGEIAGWRVEVFPRSADRSGSWSVSWPNSSIPEKQGDWSDDPVGLIRSIENVPATVQDRLAANESAEANARRVAKEAQEAASRIKGFDQQDRLDELEAKIAQLESTLAAESGDKNAATALAEADWESMEPDARRDALIGRGFPGEDVAAQLETEFGDLPTDMRGALVDRLTGGDTAQMAAPEGWGSVEADPPMTRADMKRVSDRLNEQLAEAGVKGKVTLRVVRAIIGHPRAHGLYRKGRGVVEIQAGTPFGEDQILNHELIHLLRDSTLWGREHGLFTRAEWQGLVKEVRGDPEFVAQLRERYPELSNAAIMEEGVAELYRQWRAMGGAEQGAFAKIRAFFEALASALRGEGFQSASRTMQMIADGRIGGRSPAMDTPGRRAGRMTYGPDGIASMVDDTAVVSEMRAPTSGPIKTHKKATDRGAISNALTRAMQGDFNLLGLVPGRALFTELGKSLPSAKTYLRLKERMDTLRQEWHAKTDKVAQDWRRLISKNGKANKEMMDLMHESTLAGVDPSGPFVPLVTKKDMRVLMSTNPNSPAHQWAQARMKKDVERRKAYDQMKPRFDALPQEFRDKFVEVRDQYSELADAFEAAVIDNVNKSIDIGYKRAKRAYDKEMQRIKDEGLTGKDKADAEKAAKAALDAAKSRTGWRKQARVASLRKRFESNRLEGPYFPLMRFGEFFVTVRDKKGKVVSFSRFETEKDQLAFKQEQEGVPGQTVEVGVLAPDMSFRDQVDPNFVADIEGLIGEQVGDPAVMDMIWQRYLETLPDFSIRSSRIHRKGTAGFSDDAFRAFGRQMFHGAHQLARLSYALDMQNALEEARIEARGSSDPNRNGLIVTEMERRHEFTMNPKGSKIAQTATSAAFIYYLGVTPAAAIVNLSQTTVVGTPILAAAFRKAGVTGAAKHLTKAMQDFARGRGEAGRSRRLSADEKKAMNEAYDRGVVDRTQAHDLAGVAETGVEYSAARVKWMGRISWFFHHAERMNREVTFLAAYRMAREEGDTHDQAVERGADLTWKTHFDYQNTSRPRLMQNDTAKVIFVFRNFQLNMLWRLARDTHQWARGKTADERREGRAQFLGITMSMMLHAGITGTWGYALLTTLASIVFGEPPDEIEDEIKRGVIEMFGTEVGGAILVGVPGHLTGIDLTSRIGMPELWFRSSDRMLEGDDQYNYWLQEVVGAVPGIAENIFRGANMIVKDGEIWRGIETAVPKFARDAMQAVRYANEGVQTYRGDPILDDVSFGQIMTEALGFTPAQISERYEANTRMKNREARILDERSGIHADVYRDVQEDGRISRGVMEAIEAFNAEYPTYPITRESIERSISSRRQATGRNEFGIILNPRLNEAIRNEAPPMLYN